MSSHRSIPIIGNSDTCCLFVGPFCVQVFLTRLSIVDLLLLDLKFSCKNRQSDSNTTLITPFYILFAKLTKFLSETSYACLYKIEERQCFS
jgi:hypothetical protein